MIIYRKLDPFNWRDKEGKRGEEKEKGKERKPGGRGHSRLPPTYSPSAPQSALSLQTFRVKHSNTGKAAAKDRRRRTQNSAAKIYT